jgi:Fe-S cluster biogenesis protein NfuA
MNEALLDALRPLVSGDGLNLDIRRFDPMSGTLNLRLFEGENPCTQCRMSADLLAEIALPAAQRIDRRVRRVTIEDDRAEALR